MTKTKMVSASGSSKCPMCPPEQGNIPKGEIILRVETDITGNKVTAYVCNAHTQAFMLNLEENVKSL